MNKFDDSICTMCMYCIEDDCLLDFEGAEDAEGYPAMYTDEVSQCAHFVTTED